MLKQLHDLKVSSIHLFYCFGNQIKVYVKEYRHAVNWQTMLLIFIKSNR